MRYTTEYQPAISQTCKTYIRNNINEVFASDSTAIYNIENIVEALEDDEIDQQEILQEDIKLLKQLNTENVGYIEF
jgi:uncharacterized protein YaaN involved in tellurite resistance